MNIKQYVRQILSNPEIINLTGDKTVHFLHAISPVEPYIEYEIYDENGVEWAENKETATEYYVQVNVFSKGSYSALEELIKKHMIKAGFDRSMAADLYEKDTQLFHKAMRFNISLMTSES